MAFELEVFSKTRLTDVRVLSQKNREPDTAPGAKLCFAATLSNDILSTLDGALKSTLFHRNGAIQKTQPGLDGVTEVSDLPNLTHIGKSVGTLPWIESGSGYTLTFDFGIGGSPLIVNDCTVDSIRVQGKEGGTVILKFNVESSDVSEASFGKLAKQKSREVTIKLLKPTVAQQDIDDKPPRREPLKIANSPKARAARAAENEKQIKPARADGTANSEGWPFPEGDKPKDATEIFAAGAAGDAAAATT